MKRTVRDGVLFLGLAALVWYLVFRQISLGELRAAVADIRAWWLVAAVGAMCLYFVCDALNTSRGLRHLGYGTSLGRGLEYAAVGFFFSSVTPSASGGQPMQILRMRRHGVQPGAGALVLLLELACWQIVSAAYGAAGLWVSRGLLGSLPGPAVVLAIVGMSVSLLTLAAVLAAICRPEGICRWATRVSNRLEKRPRLLKLWGAVGGQLERFAQSAPVVRRSPGLLVKMLLTTAVQLAALYSVPFWVHRALGLSGISLPAMMTMQALVSISVGALPLPGAMGVGEGGFLTVFRMLFPAQLLGSAMVLSRGVSFYLFVVLTGLGVLLFRLTERSAASVQA